MDLSYWNNYCPDIKIEHTKKQFFGQYLWRLSIEVYGARLINSKSGNLSRDIEHRKSINSLSQSWNVLGGRIKIHSTDKIDIEQLEELKQIKERFRDILRMRLEEPNIQLYAKSESDLKEIAESINAKFRTKIQSICGPSSNDAETLLKTGAIISNSKPSYNYKVFLRDGRYDYDTKQKILDYLVTLGDIVKVSPGSVKMLNKPYPSMWGAFFYTNDPGVTTFLTLISPGIILNIHKLVYQEQ